MHRQDFDAASVAQDSVALRHGFRAVRILSAFAVDVGTKAIEGGDGSWFVEDCHVIHHFEGSDQLGAFGLSNDGPGLPFDGAHTGVAVDTYDQNIAQRLRIAKTADVTDVEEIETAVCPDNRLARLRPPCAEGGQLVQGSDFRSRGQSLSRLPQDVHHRNNGARGGSGQSGGNLLADASAGTIGDVQDIPGL